VCAAETGPVSASEAKSLFADLAGAPALVLAVSGGPDSTALLLLASRWRKTLRRGPKLLAVTIDHGLRAQAAAEARAVRRLARDLGVDHRVLKWAGKKPASGLQEAAREARYHLLAKAAKKVGARHILTAHTLDDQAETVLFRLARGSGITGLAAMTRHSELFGTLLVRPLLDLPKARLIATLRRDRVAFADDASNRDPRFTRARLREVMPVLAREGLSAQRLSTLAQRMRRADAAIEAMVRAAALRLADKRAAPPAIGFDVEGFTRLPAEVALRLLGRAVATVGDEGPVELGKLENLLAALFDPQAKSATIRRTLAGALVTRSPVMLIVECAPPRRKGKSSRISALTKSKYDGRRGSHARLK